MDVSVLKHCGTQFEKGVHYHTGLEIHFLGALEDCCHFAESVKHITSHLRPDIVVSERISDELLGNPEVRNDPVWESYFIVKRVDFNW